MKAKDIDKEPDPHLQHLHPSWDSSDTIVSVKYAEGIKFYILWENCPDMENVISGWFSNKKRALDFCAKHKFQIKQ